jgi:16S rRNA (adenine1518-N6/adenine1519-N6)-dimethyltransferase
MSLYKPSELHQFLNQIGAKAKKSLSQNFLIDGNILRKIAAAAAISADDLVLEIGPGPGALTQLLLEAKARVVAVEKDALFASELKRLDPSANSLEVFEDDILKFPIEQQLKQRLKPGEKAKVVANLPYHLTTPILALLLPLHDTISSLTIMVQDEVAKRFVAQPGTSEYSSFTVFLNFYAKPHYAFFVSRHCFHPQPKVDSAVVVLHLHPPALEGPADSFFRITRQAFEHRRKMLRSSLKEIYPPEVVMEALKSIGHDPQARPERLSLDDFLALYAFLSASSGNDPENTAGNK